MNTSITTTVDCHKQVRSWRLLHSLMQLLIPTCNCATIVEDEDVISHKLKYSSAMTSNTTITGTLFGYRKGNVSFCIQEDANSTIPILLLELAVPTNILAREMRGGTLRIALESSIGSGNEGSSSSLLSTPVWTMYCNGKNVGYAVKRRPSNSDFEALSLMCSVAFGTGIMKCNDNKDYVNQENDYQLMYLRANFHRIRGSSECESFYLINPEGDIDHQELSIFFFRSR